MTPVHQLTSYKVKICVFVRKKSILKTFLTSNHDLFTGGRLVMDYLFQTCIFLLHKMLIDGLVDYCDVFYELFRLSFWRYPLTADDPLVSNDVMLIHPIIYPKSVSIKKKTNLHLGWSGVSTFSANVHFWVNCFFLFRWRFINQPLKHRGLHWNSIRINAF